jgi:peptide deformylase
MPEKIRLFSDPILRTVCKPLDFSEDPMFVVGLLETMNETMLAESGIGLAANQIGQSLRIFILKEEGSYKEFINPTVVAQSDPVVFEGEGCLSIPGASATTKRFNKLSLAWFDRNGIRNESEFNGMKAFAIQHEMDHLNGKLYIDQFGPTKKDLVLTKHRKFLKRS